MEKLYEENVEVNVTTSGEQNVNINFANILKWLLVIVGLCFIMYGFVLYRHDVEYSYNDPMRFYERSYVGGDAYNYIISAARSTAIMVKSLIWFVLGCTSIIVSRTIHNTK